LQIKFLVSKTQVIKMDCAIRQLVLTSKRGPKRARKIHKSTVEKLNKIEAAGETGDQLAANTSDADLSRPTVEPGLTRSKSLYSQCKELGAQIGNAFKSWAFGSEGYKTAKMVNVTFCMEKMINSKGIEKKDISGRFLVISEFPEGDKVGRGKYFVKGRLKSFFTFWDDHDGISTTFDGKQRNGRPFRLVLKVDESGAPIGATYTMPDEYPEFKAVFGDHTKQAQQVLEVWNQNMRSSFGRFHNKMNSDRRRRSTMASFSRFRRMANEARRRLSDAPTLEI